MLFLAFVGFLKLDTVGLLTRRARAGCLTQTSDPGCLCRNRDYIRSYAVCIDQDCWSEEIIKDNYGLSMRISFSRVM